MRSLILATISASGLVLAAGRGCDDPGTFESPGASRRAMFRYWFPDPSVDTEMVAHDLASAAAVGAGGVEFVPFYEYAGHIGPPPPGVDWSTLGFGTEPFKKHFRTALQAHADTGMLMDFALGPGMGHGVPTTSDDEGILWDLIPFTAEVPSSGWENHTIPGWADGDMKFVALVSASVLAVTNESAPPPTNQFLPAPYETYTQYLLDATTLEDLTESVSNDGKASVDGPTSDSGSDTKQVFAFYEKQTLQRALVFPNNASETIFDQGAYVVDHYSSRGAETVINFWEKYILEDEEIENLMRRVGRYGWEDSVEIEWDISWSPGIMASFEEQHGYSLRPYLPLIMWQNNNLGLQKEDPGRVRAVLNTQDRGEGYINDFRASLELGYRSYLTTLSQWLRKRFGFGLRAQVSYNLPMEMGVNIPFVDVPECESLGFKDSIDAYRQYSGPAALAGQRVVSNEVGAVFLAAYKHDIPHLLHQCDLAFAGGNNRMVLHGQSFGGNYSATTWPGHSAFNYFVSDMHSPKQPSWQAGMPEAMEYLARTQFILQGGVSKADIAVYHHTSATNTTFDKIYKSKDLEEAGFSYFYIVPDNLRYETASVKNGALGPAGFRALVLMPGAALSAQAIADLIDLAEDGLPIVISGETTVYASGNSEQTDVEGLDKLMSLPSVHRIADGTAAETLVSVDVLPFVATEVNNGTWITSRRHDSRLGIDYIFLLGADQATEGEIVVQSSGIPYVMDPWTGTVKPILHYSRSPTAITIPLSLSADETLILAFTEKAFEGVPLPDTHVAKMPLGLRTATSDKEGLELLVTADAASSKFEVQLGTGEKRQVEASTAASFTLANWQLDVEHWEAPQDLYDIDTVAVKHSTTHALTAPLPSWRNITSLQHTSGIGSYSTSFDWSAKDSGAFLEFSAVLHAIRVFVNGQQADAVDPRDPIIDISSLLQEGRNEVLVVVPSQMWNYVRTLMPDLQMAGTVAFTAPQFTVQIPLPAPVDNGLVGDVVVRPYQRVSLSV